MTRASTIWTEDIPALKIEAMEGGCVIVECEDPYGNGDASISLHPMHLRLIAEKMGLAASVTDSEAQALLMVDKLARRMRVLHERIKQVHEWMWENAERGFDDCDINIEAWYIDATLDLSKEFMAEIEESRAVVTPRTGALRKPSGLSAANPTGNPAGTQSVSGKACANPSGKASAKAAAPRNGSLFGGDHG